MAARAAAGERAAELLGPRRRVRTSQIADRPSASCSATPIRTTGSSGISQATRPSCTSCSAFSWKMKPSAGSAARRQEGSGWYARAEGCEHAPPEDRGREQHGEGDERQGSPRRRRAGGDALAGRSRGDEPVPGGLATNSAGSVRNQNVRARMRSGAEGTYCADEAESVAGLRKRRDLDDVSRVGGLDEAAAADVHPLVLRPRELGSKKTRSPGRSAHGGIRVPS